VREIVDGLRAAGAQVTLFEPRYRSDENRPGLLGRVVPMLRTELRAIAALRSADVLYVRHHFATLPVLVLAALLRKPLVQEINGPSDDLFIAWPQLRPVRGPMIWMARIPYHWTDEVITVTPQLGAWLETEPGRHRVSVIRNGADVNLFHPNATRPPWLPSSYVMFFGALAPWQGIVTMLSATEHPDWPAAVRLVIAGDGLLRETVENAVGAGRVIFLGSRPQGELPGIVAGSIASLIVKDHPAHAESGLSPLKLYESMAAGVPIVVSALPGLQDTIERHDCGIVVPAADVAAVARAVAALHASPELAARLGDNGRRAAVAEHSWQASADATAQVVARAMHRHTQGLTGGPRLARVIGAPAPSRRSRREAYARTVNDR